MVDAPCVTMMSHRSRWQRLGSSAILKLTMTCTSMSPAMDSGKEVMVRNLRIALSKIEKGSQLIERLNELKKSDEVDDAAYESKLEQFETLVKEGETELEAIRGVLTTKLAALRRDLERYPQELKDLELKSKLGEIDASAFMRQDQKLRARIKKLEDDVEETDRLLAAETAEAAGGFIDVAVDGKSTTERLVGWIRRKR